MTGCVCDRMPCCCRSWVLQGALHCVEAVEQCPLFVFALWVGVGHSERGIGRQVSSSSKLQPTPSIRIFPRSRLSTTQSRQDRTVGHATCASTGNYRAKDRSVYANHTRATAPAHPRRASRSESRRQRRVLLSLSSQEPPPPTLAPAARPQHHTVKMPTQWVDWSKTTHSKDYRGSGSFATFLIIGRTLRPPLVPPIPIFPPTFPPPQSLTLSPPTKQPSASSSASSSPPSPTTSPSSGRPTPSAPTRPTSTTSRPTCASCTSPPR
jgi:hypothetical protein